MHNYHRTDAQLDAAFTREGKKCYTGCKDPSRDNGMIKADGFFPGKSTSGALVHPQQWCSEEASGY